MPARNNCRLSLQGLLEPRARNPGKHGSEGALAVTRPGYPTNTFADHLAVLTVALRQVLARMRSRLLVRVDGAGVSHELISHLLSLATSRRRVLVTCGWAITAADERAIGLLPAAARRAGVDRPPRQAVA